MIHPDAFTLTHRVWGHCLIALCLLFSITDPAGAVIPEYEFVDLTYNGETLIPYGISNDGTIVGQWHGQGWRSGFVLRNGLITSLDVPGGDITEILGINPSGTSCVGAYYDHADRAHAFEYRLGGDILRLPDLGDMHSNTVATDITDSGLVVGSYYRWIGHPDDPNIPTPIGEAFVMEGDEVRTYSAPGAGYTHFGGVNNAGQIAGYWNVGRPEAEDYPFLLEGDSLSPLPLSFQSSQIEPTDINNLGQIVGWGHHPGFGRVGYLIDGADEAIYRYPQPILDWTQFTGINDNGVIVGYRYESLGRRGFIAYPKHAIPEPSSLALLLAGLPLAFARGRRSVLQSRGSSALRAGVSPRDAKVEIHRILDGS